MHALVSRSQTLLFFVWGREEFLPVLQGLIIGKPLSQYASYLAMFCPLYSNISKNSIKSISEIHPAITENTEYTRETHAQYLDT